MRYEVHIHQKARKSLSRLPLGKQKGIIALLESMVENPRPDGCIKLGGKLDGLYRIRSGNYRVVYQVKDKELIVFVLRIGKRGDIYLGNIDV
ncbi:MAG: type II toxin-antitoxin system RelE/ParE family toxin [Candidatus Glassbacteria bacterium]|nr:type II toxin-antitoxin system RelE/ParE family toxin [Candidatus Glassbacteria bacterium]